MRLEHQAHTLQSQGLEVLHARERRQGVIAHLRALAEGQADQMRAVVCGGVEPGGNRIEGGLVRVCVIRCQLSEALRLKRD